jgi:hypothetical protein
MAIIEKFSTAPSSSEDDNKFRLDALEKLLKHHYELIVSKEKLIHGAAMDQMKRNQ